VPSSTSYDLLQACRQPGCPVCRVEQSAVERYINSLLYESVNDIQVRERLRASMGFCREHAQMAVDKKLGSALGFAIIYQDVINNILRQLRSDVETPSTRRWSTLLKRIPEQVSATVQKVLYALTPQKHCIACQQRDRTLHLIISSLIENLHEPEMIEALQTSEGLCIPHLKKAFESVSDPQECDLLLSVHREKLEVLRGELAEFVRKNDYRFKDEGMGTEGDSWRRAIAKMIGLSD
jgi:Family of unknown function (DUF6062)